MSITLFLRSYRQAILNKSLNGIARQGAFAIQAPLEENFPKKMQDFCKEHPDCHFLDYNSLLTPKGHNTINAYISKKPVLLCIDNIINGYHDTAVDYEKYLHTNLAYILANDYGMTTIPNDFEHFESLKNDPTTLVSQYTMGIVMTGPWPLYTLLYHATAPKCILFPQNAKINYYL